MASSSSYSSRPSPPLELDSTLSPLDALASHTRKLTVKKIDQSYFPPSLRPGSSASSANSAPVSPSSSTSNYTRRTALHALHIPNHPRPRSPLLSPQFSDVRPSINQSLPRPFHSQDHTRDSSTTFQTDSTDYLWDHSADEQDDQDPRYSGIPVYSNQPPRLARQPSTGHVARCRVRAEAPREQITSLYGHQDLLQDAPLPSSPHAGPSSGHDERLEVLDHTDPHRQTWNSTTSALSDTDTEAGWESKYASGHSISSEDPFQYSHYETPRNHSSPKKPFATFPTRLPTLAPQSPLLPHPKPSGASVPPPVSHVRNFSRPLRPPVPPTKASSDLPTPPPSRDMSPREPVGRARASTINSRSSVETASSGATRRSLKNLFNRLRHNPEPAPSPCDPSPTSPATEAYHPPAITFNLPVQQNPDSQQNYRLAAATASPHIHFAEEPAAVYDPEKEKEKAKHRLSIYSLPAADDGPSGDKQRYASRSPVSLDHPSPLASSSSPRMSVCEHLEAPPQPQIFSARRHSQLPAAMAKAKASLGPRASSSTGRTAQDYLQLGIEAHEQGEMERSAGLFERSAREGGGCGTGMLMWGLAQRHGWGCQVNEVRAFKWLQKAAESVVEDVEKVARGKEEASAMKNELVLAIYELGMCFMRGWGCKKDKALAISYFELAAKLGDPDAQQGFCYANGKGAKKDLKKAAKYYRMASKQGIEMMGSQWIWKSKYD